MLSIAHIRLIPLLLYLGLAFSAEAANYLGTLVQMYDHSGQLTWDAEYDIYGNVRKLRGERSLIPFRFPGQYEDGEIGLYYNRNRYYDPEDGCYISQDPIRLLSGEYGFYNYVHDPTGWIDPLGLAGKSYKKMTTNEIREFLGSPNWHKNGAKTKYLKKHKKSMKGDTNADFYRDTKTNEVILITNRKKIEIQTGDFF